MSQLQQSSTALVLAAIARVGSAATLTDIAVQLRSAGHRLDGRTLRVYLQRMHATGLISKWDDGARNSHEGEYVFHELTRAGRRLLHRWQIALGDGS